MKDRNPFKSNLGRIQPEQIDKEKIKREGWNNDGILVIKADDQRLSWPEKELIRQIGDKIYKNKNSKNNNQTHNQQGVINAK
jgi:hypothetical protein